MKQGMGILSKSWFSTVLRPQQLTTGKPCRMYRYWCCIMLSYIIKFNVHLIFRVIHIDEDSAIEYDCTENFLSHSYCIHIMSRTPTMSEEKLQQLLEYAGKLLLTSLTF